MVDGLECMGGEGTVGEEIHDWNVVHSKGGGRHGIIGDAKIAMGEGLPGEGKPSGGC